MKKFLLAAVVVCSAALFASCSGNKKAQAQQDNEEAIVIADNVKQQAIQLLKSANYDVVRCLNEIEIVGDEVRIVPVKFFLDVTLAEKAQTAMQKAQLIGCYMADQECDKWVFGKNNSYDERKAAVLKLAADLNMSDNNATYDEIDQMSKEAAATKISEMHANDLTKALENQTADQAVVTLVYTVVETSLCKIGVAELRDDEYDQQIIFKEILDQKKMMGETVQLYNLLAPYYKSLEPMKELIDKAQALVVAEDETDVDVALLSYVNYIKQLRGKIAATLS